MKRTLFAAVIATALISTTAYAEVSVMSGGIGQDERDAIIENQKDYSLKLVFTGEGGMYVSRVVVKITDKDGVEVVNTTTNGPFLLVGLAPGKYTIEAIAEETTKKFAVNVGKHLNTQQVNFPIKDGRTI